MGWSIDNSTSAELAAQEALKQALRAEVAADTTIEVIAEAEQVTLENKIIPLTTVDTVSLRNSIYPNPLNGSLVTVNQGANGNAETYRFVTGTGWVLVDKYNGTTVSNITAQLAGKAEQSYAEATNLRVDNLVIPISAENANIEVTDAHVSTTKNKTFSTINNRFEDVEKETKVIKFPIDNYVTNADFVNFSGWSAIGASLATVANTLRITATGGQVNAVATFATTQVWGAGKKMFGVVRARVTNPNCLKLQFYIRNAGGAIKIIEVLNPVENQWYTMQGDGESTATTALSVWLTHVYVDTATATGKVAEFQKVLVTDINPLFGSENVEFTKGKIITDHVDKWANGTITLYNDKDVIQRLIELSKQSLTSDIKGTKQTIVFNTDGTVQRIQHKDVGLVVLREDIFTYTSTLITEVRTLSTGQSLTLKYNLVNFETEVI